MGLGKRLGVNRLQAIGWANVNLDLYQHVTSLGHLWLMQNGIDLWSNLCLYEGWGVWLGWRAGWGVKTNTYSLFIFSCDRAALWMAQSVRLSVGLSVCLWNLFHYVPIISITNGRSDVHAKGQGQKSKVKVTEVTTQLNRFRTITPVWTPKWW